LLLLLLLLLPLPLPLCSCGITLQLQLRHTHVLMQPKHLYMRPQPCRLVQAGSHSVSPGTLLHHRQNLPEVPPQHHNLPTKQLVLV
jgi:hypothetical protein